MLWPGMSQKHRFGELANGKRALGQQKKRYTRTDDNRNSGGYKTVLRSARQNPFSLGCDPSPRTQHTTETYAPQLSRVPHKNLSFRVLSPVGTPLPPSLPFTPRYPPPQLPRCICVTTVLWTCLCSPFSVCIEIHQLLGRLVMGNPIY